MEASEPVWVESEGYYEVSSAEGLRRLAEWVNTGNSTDLKYVQTADIDLGGVEWTPIGISEGTSDSKFFKGVYDGNGKIISNLSIKNFNPSHTGRKYAGLFGHVKYNNAKGAALRNIRIVSADIAIDYTETGNPLHVGTLAGAIYNYAVENSVVQGAKIDVTSRAELFAGGLIGKADAQKIDYSIIENCLAVSVISCDSGTATAVGGLAGIIIRTALEECATKTQTNLTRSDVENNIFATGGLVGRMSGSNVSNTTSYGVANVKNASGKTYAGGLTGQMYGSASNDITTSLSLASVSAPSAVTGGLIGHIEGAAPTVKSCDWRLFADAPEAGIGSDAATNKTDQRIHARSADSAALADEEYFINRGWDIGGVWSYSPLDGRSAPNPSFIFADGDLTALKPEMLILLPRSAHMLDDTKTEAIFFTAHFEPSSLTFEGLDAFETGGVHLTRHPDSVSRFSVSADGYVTEASLDVEIAATIGGYPQKSTFSLSVDGDIEITTGELPPATAGTPYIAVLSIRNADGLPTFRCTSTMPPGLNIAADSGAIYGTPKEAGAFELTVEASDSRHSARKKFALSVADDKKDEDDKNDENNKEDEKDDEDEKTSITEIFSPLNESLSDANVGTISSAPTGYNAITSIGNCEISAIEKILFGGEYAAIADSFRVSIPLGPETDGDALALSYSAPLTQVEAFEDWRSLGLSERAALLDEAGIEFLYEFISDDGESSFAALIGGEGLVSWHDALLTGIARLTPDGVAVKYAAVDAEGAPYIDGDFIVIPDGTVDSIINDPVWLVKSTGKNNNENNEEKQKEEANKTGGTGCTTGTTAFALLGLSIALLRRRG